MVLFHFIEGREPTEDDDLIRPFEHLGTLSARLHAHAREWRRPVHFTRLTWDGPGMLAANGHWGDWRAAAGLDGPALALLERLCETLNRRLAAFGRSPDRFGLIHAETELARSLGPAYSLGACDMAEDYLSRA